MQPLGECLVAADVSSLARLATLAGFCVASSRRAGALASHFEKVTVDCLDEGGAVPYVEIGVMSNRDRRCSVASVRLSTESMVLSLDGRWI